MDESGNVNGTLSITSSEGACLLHQPVKNWGVWSNSHYAGSYTRERNAAPAHG